MNLRTLYVLTLLTSLAFAADEDHAHEGHVHALAPASIESSDFRKYAPSRHVDILHLALDVTPDFAKRTVAGTTTLRFKPIAKPIDELRLDAVDLNVNSVTATGAHVSSHQVTARELIIHFAQPVPADTEVVVTIAHWAEPAKGLYFRTPEMGYRPGEAHLFTQGETTLARHWYPSFDEPNEKFTSEVTCHVPEGMRVFSNGRLVSETKDPRTGLRSFRWLQELPHVNYLLTLVAGPFKTIEDKHRDIPLTFHVLPSEEAQAMNSFQNTKDAMAFFEKEIGVPYPWVKYGQICVNDFVTGGMENTTLTSLTDQTLFTKATENLRTSDGLVAHELAHQWFGDLVTCKDWSHIWLNEGFAVYYTHLYLRHLRGQDEFTYRMYNDARTILTQANDTWPIVYRQYTDPMQQFGYRAYPKGSWVLHMLRSQLGDDLYRAVVKTYLERHRFGSVTTENLNTVVEELSGRSFDQFFDQWLYHARQPELEVKQSWDAKTKLAKLSIAQTQKLGNGVLLFNFPLKVKFRTKAGVVSREIVVKEKAEDFHFALPDAPEVVRVDPDLALLAKIKFELPATMLRAQLADLADMPGRLFAIEQLATKKDKTTVEALGTALRSDPFWGVRVEAAKALRKIRTDEALAALIDSLDQPDARARDAAVGALAGFYDERASAAARDVLRREKNPTIIGRALAVLGNYATPEAHQLLVAALTRDSYQDEISGAAIAALKVQGDPACLPQLARAIETQFQDFAHHRWITRALEAYAFLARNEENRDKPREFLTTYVRSPRSQVRTGAIAALGTLGDPKAIAVLETFAGMAADAPERIAADKAIASVRAGNRPADDLQTLRTEVTDLKDRNQTLHKDLETLRKEFEASRPAPSEDNSLQLSPENRNARQALARIAAEAEGWTYLFDGRSLDGWKASENPATFSVKDGAIVVKGPRAHLYYDGSVSGHVFTNFELSLEVMTFPQANSGVYFHTEFQPTGWPAKGYEVQVNTTHGDPDRTGGLWGVKPNPTAFAKDNEWATLTIRVLDKHVTTRVNGEIAASYTEEENPVRKPQLAGRLLSRGTFALQGHDPKSEVHYRNIRVRILREPVVSPR